MNDFGKNKHHMVLILTKTTPARETVQVACLPKKCKCRNFNDCTG
jgi:sulfur relay (sulfurtransferase) DsrC/TusE family protein